MAEAAFSDDPAFGLPGRGVSRAPRAGWRRPLGRPERVGALMIDARDGGRQRRRRYASMNLGSAVGDEPARGRRQPAPRFAAATAAPRRSSCARCTAPASSGIGAADARRSADADADASVTTEPGVACIVQVADCLPVLLAAPTAVRVAAAHAGWRGLAAGVARSDRRRRVRGGGLQRRATSSPGSGSASARAPSRSAPTCWRRSAPFPARPDLPRFVPAQPAQVARRPRRPGAATASAAAGVERSVGAAAGAPSTDASRFFSYRRDRHHRADGRRRLDSSRPGPGAEASCGAATGPAP